MSTQVKMWTVFAVVLAMALSGSVSWIVAGARSAPNAEAYEAELSKLRIENAAIRQDLAARTEAMNSMKAKLADAQASSDRHAAEAATLAQQLGAYRADVQQASARKLDDLFVGASGIVGPVRVIQVVGEKDMLADWNGNIIWLHGIRTKNLADGSTVDASGCKVTGTKQYETSTHSMKTVFVLESMGYETPQPPPGVFGH